MPALLLIAALAVVTVAVWAAVLGRVRFEPTGCPPPPPDAPDYSGEVLAPTALDEVAPAPPRLAPVRVLNGNGMRGEAGIVTGRLDELGFAVAGAARNDPLHPDFELSCHGQIRFGPRGEAAARTVSLVVPCAELVRDARDGDAVDLALGTEFTAVRPTPAARAALTGLTALGQPALRPEPQPASHRGGQVGEQVEPAVDAELLAAARDVRC